MQNSSTNERSRMPPPRRAARSSPVSATNQRAPVAVQRTIAPAMAGPPIRSVADGRSQSLAVMIYAEPGDGKTTLVGSCADIVVAGVPSKVLIIRPPVDHTDSIANPEVDEWVVSSWAEMDDAMLYSRNGGASKYDWVWLDSLGLWQDHGLDDIWADVISKKPHRAEYGLDKGEYGRNMGRIGVWVRGMIGSPDFHFGLTCHPRQAASTEDEDNPNNKLMPYVQGKMMSPKICGYMNVVGYLHKEDLRGKRARVLELQETDKFYAKVGFHGWDTQRIINPTMPKLVDALKATGTDAADAVDRKKTDPKASAKRKPTTKVAVKRPAPRRTK
jgi:hypothetical protein